MSDEKRRERSWRESTFPKCKCGATLSLATVRDGGSLCRRCDEKLQECPMVCGIETQPSDVIDALRAEVEQLKRQREHITAGYHRRKDELNEQYHEVEQLKAQLKSETGRRRDAELDCERAFSREDALKAQLASLQKGVLTHVC